MTKQDQVKEEERFVQLISLADRDVPEVDTQRLSHLREKMLAVFADGTRSDAHVKITGAKLLVRLGQWLIPAAVALIVVTGIALWPFGSSTSSSHVIAKVPDNILQSRTLHWRRTLVDAYGSAHNRKFEHLTSEVWVDLETGRYRHRIIGTALRDDGELTNDNETIFDGEFILGIYNSDRQAIYWRVSSVRRQIELRMQTNQFLQQTGMSDPERLKTFTKARQEVIEGQRYDVWVGTIPVPSYGSGDRTVNAWLYPETGELHRLEIHAANQGPTSMGFQRCTYELIDRNLAMSDELFSTDFKPPVGFVMKNTKTTAELDRFSNGFGNSRGGILFRVNVLFTLQDGCMIVGWSNELADKTVDQGAIFEGLEIGGPLPDLPVVITGVKTIGAADIEVSFLGRHLASTHINGQHYAWSLFVPERPVPPAEQFFGYTFQYGTVSNDPRNNWGSREVDSRSLAIDTDDDFNLFVRGTMAEYSDNGSVLSHITPEHTRRLAEQIRQLTR